MAVVVVNLFADGVVQVSSAGDEDPVVHSRRALAIQRLQIAFARGVQTGVVINCMPLALAQVIILRIPCVTFSHASSSFVQLETARPYRGRA